MPRSRVINRVVSIESSSRFPEFFNRLMSPAISVLNFRVVLHAAQSSRQSSRRNRVVESVSRNFQSTGESCHLSIEIPYNFACRAVEASIESPQSSRRVGLRKFPSRLMGPVISVLDFPVLLHVAQSSRQSGHHSQVVGSFSRNF